MTRPALTDDQIRIRFFMEECGMKSSDAQDYVQAYPKAATMLEAGAILRERVSDFTQAVVDAALISRNKLRSKS